MNELKEVIKAVKEAELAVINAQERGTMDCFQTAEVKLNEAKEKITKAEDENISEQLHQNNDFLHAKEHLKHLLEAQNALR